MSRKFSVRPTLTLSGREFHGLRGWAGKPLHPPLTDVPIGLYLLAGVLDVVSYIGGTGHAWAHEFFHAGTYAFVGGVAVSILAALTGTWDWWKSSEPGTQARRTINTHATIMVTVTLVAVADLVWRLVTYHTYTVTSVGIMILSIIVAGLVSVGATFGGTLVFDYGFNVETAGDSPVWHQSEIDIRHGQEPPAPTE
ncbi:MAG TPA: DUF2231 domain-containing protein [Mycobacteriales bacterium]